MAGWEKGSWSNLLLSVCKGLMNTFYGDFYLETCCSDTVPVLQQEPLTGASPAGTAPPCSSSARSPAAPPLDEVEWTRRRRKK